MTDSQNPASQTTVIPRWRFGASRHGADVVFKSKKSPHNNVHAILRFYAVGWGIKRWGYTVTPRDWVPGYRSVHVGLGKKWCIDIHIAPYRRQESA